MIHRVTEEVLWKVCCFVVWGESHTLFLFQSIACDPHMVYRTPGFQPGSSGFNSWYGKIKMFYCYSVRFLGGREGGGGGGGHFSL